MEPDQEEPAGRMSRARFFQLAAGTGAAVVLGARGGFAGASSVGHMSTRLRDTSEVEAAAKPRRGGTLRMGWPSGGSLESFDTHLGDSNPINLQMQSMVYDTLTNLDAHGHLLAGLASRVEPNAKATEYLIELRHGVRWHDGSPLTPEDVVYSLHYSHLPANQSSSFLQMIDAKGMKKVGKSQVRVPLLRPYARFAGVLAGPGLAVIKDGTKKFRHPVGTGAFKVSSFVAGQQTKFVRNPDYWAGAPHVDGAVMLSFNDPTAEMNALLAGDVDVINEVPGATAKANASNPSVKIHLDQRTVDRVFVMRVDKPPFNDNRVRQAMKLLVDRPALLEDAHLGFGVVANDILGKGLMLYDDHIPQRKQDIAHAKHLLKQAGHSDLTVTLKTSDAIGDMSEAAVIFSQQAAKAGVTVKVDKVPASSYFNTSNGYLSYLFSQDSWPTTTFEAEWDQLLRTNSPANQTHWKREGWDVLMNQAEAEQNTAKAKELWAHLQKVQHDRGGYIDAVNVKTIGAYRTNVHNAERDWGWMPTLNHVWLS